MRRGFLPSAFAVAVALVACGGSSATDLFGGGGDAATDGAGALGDGAASLDGSAPGDLDGAAPGTDSGGSGKDASAGGTCPSPAGTTAGDGGLTCNGLVLQGTPLPTSCHGGPAPVPKGGMLRDGLYVLDQLDFYGDPNSCPKTQERIVWNICGSRWSSVQDYGMGTSYYTVDAALGVTPGQVTLNLVCPSLTTVQDHYDAATDSFTLYVALNGGIRLDRFKRQ